MAEKLTYEQQQAVTNRGGKLLVSAAAGSGKTKVLVDRLMSYILDPFDPANIDDFLIITYTKAAAAELRGKIAAKLSELIAANPQNRHLQQQIQRLYLAKISTVHGFCTDVLRQYAYRLDISADFRVADEGECFELQMKALDQVLNDSYESAGESPCFCAFVDSQGLGRDDRQIPEIVLKVYNSAVCHLNPAKWLQWCVPTDSEDLTDAGQTPWGSYLIEDLKAYLSLQIRAMERCVAAAMKSDGMEKPTALFIDTIQQLKELCACKTWDEIVLKQGIDFGRLTFPKNCSNLQLAEQMKAVRNACKAGLAKRMRSFADVSKQVLADIATSESAIRGLLGLATSFSEQYSKLKRARGILDFSDLEHKMLDLLMGKQRNAVTAIAGEIGDQFREIMVDEYQDSNEIQDAIFSALTQKRQNCFMVGDVKQSIYQFRLADPSIFIEKYNTYSTTEVAKNGEGRKVLLSHNFRSSGGVISAVNDVFSLCMSPSVGGLTYGNAEMLREGIPHISLDEPEVSLFAIEVESDTYAEEAAFVADKIHSLLDGTHTVRNGDSLRPIKPEDIVILLRSPGSVGGEFQYALQSRGIRCVTADQADLLQTEEVSTVRAILEIMDNSLLDIPLVSVLTSPIFGFTAEELALLRSQDKKQDIYSLVCNSNDPKCRNFVNVFHSLRQKAGLSTVTQLLVSIYTDTNLLCTYSAMPDGETKLNNLQSFFQIVSDYESNGPRELSRFLEFLNSAEQRGLGGAASDQEVGAVKIMSIHKSKGLEFPVVFLCGLSRTFNQESARDQVLCDKDLGLGLGCVDSNLRVRYPTVAKRAISTKILREGISEEMRVLYVAMTRARDRLFMTYAEKNLSGTLQDMAMRLDMTDMESLACEADCPGAWILQTALKRTEAGELFALAGHPNCAQVSENQWEIKVVRSNVPVEESDSEEIAENEIPKEVLDRLVKELSFSYGHSSATKIPSKITATQLKGRAVDTEISEGSAEHKSPVFRKPGKPYQPTGISFGNAIHAVMQYLQFSSCDSADKIRNEISRMEREKLISPEQAQMADCQKIAQFFKTPIGERLMNGSQVIREFKFSLLDDASKYYADADGEKVLLQGVVDCALIEDDGITVLDFKTDYVTEESIYSVTAKYKTQVMTYASALERIYHIPVKSALLYFFSLDRLVELI